MKVPVHFGALCRRSPNSVANTKKDHRKCHNLSPLYQDETPDPTMRIWMFKMTACHPSELLYGPACLRSRVVIYPCERYKCVIICPCGLCSGLISSGSEYSVQYRFEDHQQYHSAPHNNCSFCTEIFSLIPGFYCRKLITESGGSFPSPSRFVLKKAYEFGHHYTYSTSKKSLSCEECGKSFKKSCNRERHLRNVHYQQKYECVQCGKLFGRQDNLKNHMRVHEQRDKASTAGIDNSDSDDHSSEESIETGLSLDTFDRNEEETDMEAESDSSEDDNVVFEGAHCGRSKDTKVDSDKGLSEESIKTTLLSEPFKMNEDSDPEGGGSDHSSHTSDEAKVCENDIEDNESSDSIMNVCKNCYQDFSSKFNLSRHEKKIKHSCEECQDSFCLKSTLSAHMKAKHGRKGFRCSNCEQEFSTKQNLRRHVENQSAHQCNQCNAVFCNAHALQGHVFSDHTCKRCQICGNDYEYLNRHVENIHGNSSTK